MSNLLEKYSKRLTFAESIYTKRHNEKMPSFKKLLVAKMLENTQRFFNESFTNSVGTQQGNIGKWKMFALNVGTAALPNLVAPELVAIHPLSDWTGNFVYLNYVAGSDKGGVRRGDLFNGVYSLGKMDENRMNYTADRVVETIGDGEKFMTLAWTPVVGSVKVCDAFGNDVPFTLVPAEELTYFFDKRLNPFHNGEDEAYQSAIALPERNEGETDEAYVDRCAQAREIQLGAYAAPVANPDNGWRGGYGTNAKNKAEAKYAIILDNSVLDGQKRVSYLYDNVVIPQDDLPILSAHMESIHLDCKVRRIAIYFSTIAAFQAKAEYGLELGAQLAEQAVGELAFEIDSEIVAGLADAAPLKKDLVYNGMPRVGVSVMDTYAGFGFILERAKAKIFSATQKFSPSYILVAPDLLAVLSFIPNFTPAPAQNVAGPYVAGVVNGLKVVVSPMMKEGTFVIGVNGGDLKTSAAVYAPFMPIVPTQLLEFADHANSQGFATIYDFKILSKLPTGTKEDSIENVYNGRTSTEDRPFSPLLVKGMVVYTD